MSTKVQASAATLGGFGFSVESKDIGHILVQSTTHKLTPAGVIAVLGAVNTYISGLGSTTFGALAATNAGASVTVSPGFVRFPSQSADVAANITTLTGILTTAANVARG